MQFLNANRFIARDIFYLCILLYVNIVLNVSKLYISTYNVS